MAGKGWVNQPPEDARTGGFIHPVKGRQAGAMTVSSAAWASGAQGQGFRFFSPESLPSSVRETCAARGGPNRFPATYMNPKRDGFDGGAHHRSSAGHTFMRAANSNEHSVPRRKLVRFSRMYQLFPGNRYEPPHRLPATPETRTNHCGRMISAPTLVHCVCPSRAECSEPQNNREANSYRLRIRLTFLFD